MALVVELSSNHDEFALVVVDDDVDDAVIVNRNVQQLPIIRQHLDVVAVVHILLQLIETVEFVVVVVVVVEYNHRQCVVVVVVVLI